MKCLYKSSLYLLLFLFAMLLAAQSSNAQCPDGQPEGGTAFDTTILIPAGIVSKNVKFPQFDPQSGMVTSVRLCVIEKVPKRNQANNTYRLNYTVGNGESGMYYFRIKQVYTNEYVRYSNIKQMELETSVTAKFSVYPNPSTGIVGIKFDNKMHGHFKIQIHNTQGQVAVEQDIFVEPGSPYLQLGALVPGVFWLRVTDEKNLDSGVTQLLIK